MKNTRKAQGAIEYLLMIGATILVVAVVIVGINGVMTQTNGQTKDVNALSPLKNLLNLSSDPEQITSSLFKEMPPKQTIKINGIEIL